MAKGASFHSVQSTKTPSLVAEQSNLWLIAHGDSLKHVMPKLASLNRAKDKLAPTESLDLAINSDRHSKGAETLQSL